jgi:hypothetical protein
MFFFIKHSLKLPFGPQRGRGEAPKRGGKVGGAASGCFAGCNQSVIIATCGIAATAGRHPLSVGNAAG